MKTTQGAFLDDAAWLKEGPVAQVLSLLDRDGEEARVVGGAVRNALFSRPLHEFDVATTALPEEVTRRAQAAGHKVIPTGIDHGTVTILIGRATIEVTTLRQDVETFGRKATVAFGRDWRGDALRRDFTINALSVTRAGTIHDYTGGLADIEHRRVRFIGEPAQRIAEDYLRILRFFRFHADYGEGPIDAAGLHACIEAREGLALLSRERVRVELLKTLLTRHAVAAFVTLAESGLLLSLLAGVPQLASLSNMIKLEALHASADAVRRLGALGLFIADDAGRLMERLRLSNAEHKRLAAMAQDWWRVKPGDEHAARALLYRLGPDGFADRVLLAWTRAPASDHDPAWRDLLALPRRWSAPVFPLAAEDFMRRGVPRGPALGEALRAAEQNWIDADFPGDTDALAALVEAQVRRARFGAQ